MREERAAGGASTEGEWKGAMARQAGSLQGNRDRLSRGATFNKQALDHCVPLDARFVQ